MDTYRDLLLAVPPTQFMNELSTTLSKKPHVIQPTGPNSVNIIRNYLPAWAVILGILGLLIFLLGVIFFFVRRSTVGATVSWTEVPGGVRVTTAGSDLTTNSMLGFFLGRFPELPPSEATSK
jgi:hypothetical protein